MTLQQYFSVFDVVTKQSVLLTKSQIKCNVSSAQNPFNFDADPDPGYTLEKMDQDPDPNPDPANFFKIY